MREQREDLRRSAWTCEKFDTSGGRNPRRKKGSDKRRIQKEEKSEGKRKGSKKGDIRGREIGKGAEGGHFG